MCGILTYISKSKIKSDKIEQIVEQGLKSSHRGPDNTQFKSIGDPCFWIKRIWIILVKNKISGIYFFFFIDYVLMI